MIQVGHGFCCTQQFPCKGEGFKKPPPKCTCTDHPTPFHESLKTKGWDGRNNQWMEFWQAPEKTKYIKAEIKSPYNELWQIGEEFIPTGRSRGHGLEPKTKNLDEVDLSSLSARTFLDLITNNNPLAIVGDLLVVGRGTVPTNRAGADGVTGSSI